MHGHLGTQTKTFHRVQKVQLALGVVSFYYTLCSIWGRLSDRYDDPFAHLLQVPLSLFREGTDCIFLGALFAEQISSLENPNPGHSILLFHHDLPKNSVTHLPFPGKLSAAWCVGIPVCEPKLSDQTACSLALFLLLLWTQAQDLSWSLSPIKGQEKHGVGGKPPPSQSGILLSLLGLGWRDGMAKWSMGEWVLC